MTSTSLMSISGVSGAGVDHTEGDTGGGLKRYLTFSPNTGRVELSCSFFGLKGEAGGFAMLCVPFRASRMSRGNQEEDRNTHFLLGYFGC